MKDCGTTAQEEERKNSIWEEKLLDCQRDVIFSDDGM
jgi:hypothetical protein